MRVVLLCPSNPLDLVPSVASFLPRSRSSPYRGPRPFPLRSLAGPLSRFFVRSLSHSALSFPRLRSLARPFLARSLRTYVEGRSDDAGVLAEAVDGRDWEVDLLQRAQHHELALDHVRGGDELAGGLLP